MSKVKAHVGRQGRVSKPFPSSQPGHAIWAYRAIRGGGVSGSPPAWPWGSAPSLLWELSIPSGLSGRRGLVGIVVLEYGFGLLKEPL